MDTNELKNAWKPLTEAHIPSYSDAELKTIIVKSVKKTMGVNLFVSIAFIAGCIGIMAKIIMEENWEMRIKDAIILSVLLWLFFRTKYRAHKMMKKLNSQPIKEWLEDRIAELKKQTRFSPKREIPIYCFAILLGIGAGFWDAHLMLLNFNDSPLSVVLFIVSLTIAFVFGIPYSRGRLKKRLKQWEEFHKQLED